MASGKVRMEMILDSITDKVFAVDNQWRYTYFNKQAEAQLVSLGTNPAQVMGKVLWEEFPHPPSEEALRRAMAEGVPTVFEHYYPPSAEWVEVRIYPQPDGGLAMFEGFVTERRRTEAALCAAKVEAERRAHDAEEAQSTLRTIMEHTPACITLAGGPPDYPIIANSKQALRLLGRAPQTLLNISAGYPPAAYGILLSDGVTRPRPEQLPLYRATRHGEVIKNEIWIVERADGSRIDALFNAAPIRDSHGEIIGAINCWINIPERKRALEPLWASEEHFRRYFDLGLVGMATTSPTKGIIEVNDELCRILGYERGDLLKKTWAEMTHPADLAADIQQFDRVMAGEIDGYTLNKRWIRGDGRIINSIVSAKCMRHADGSVGYFVKLLQDITERKRAEEALCRSEAHLADGQRLSHTGSWGYDVLTSELCWSDELFRICGLDPTNFKPSYAAFFDLVHCEERSGVRESFETTVRERRDFQGHYRIVRPSGEVRHVHCLAHPVRNGAGELVEYVGTIIDTSERRHAEAALHSAIDEIKKLRDQLALEKQYLEEEIRTVQGFEEIIGESAALKQILKHVESVAPTDSTVLIQGETGTGKELIARAIHTLSSRRERTFVNINCAAIPDGLLESELFGHEKGAFTGAVARKAGRFELADGGTVLLDEVGEIPLALQSKLLRFLQEHEFERVGGTSTLHADIRFIAATNRDLGQMVEDKNFRADLYYRLWIFPITMPPLRERSEDIPNLIWHFTRKYALQMNKPITSISQSTMTALCQYAWPGNIRELENIVERSAILSRGSTLDVPLGELKVARTKPAMEVITLEGVEREHILRTLERCNWVVGGPSGAAAKLGMKRTSLQDKMKRLGITRHSSPPDRHA